MQSMLSRKRPLQSHAYLQLLTLATMQTTLTSLPSSSSRINLNISSVNLGNSTRNVSCNSICELNPTTNHSRCTTPSNHDYPNGGNVCTFSFSLEENDHELNHDEKEDLVGSVTSPPRFLPFNFDHPLTQLLLHLQ